MKSPLLWAGVVLLIFVAAMTVIDSQKFEDPFSRLQTR